MKWPAALDTRLKYQSVLRDISRDARLDIGAPVVADGFYEPIDDATLQRNYHGDLPARWIQSGAAVSGALVWPEQLGSGESDATLTFVPEFAPLDAALLARAGVTEEPERSTGLPPAYAVYALPNPPAPLRSPLSFTKDGQAMLALQAVVGPPSDTDDLEGDQLVLYSDWQVLAMLPSDLAVFVHLVDASGHVVAQFDGLDAAAETLRPGDRVLQKHSLPLTGEFPNTPLTLQIGLYQRSDGSRFITTDQQDMAVVGTCQVQANEDSQTRVSCDLPVEW